MLLEEFNGDIVQWLRGFYFAARYKNYSLAAKHMQVNRAAVRYHVHRLEQKLGVVLFDRVNDVMCLTPEGERLFRWAEDIFDIVNTMLNDVAQPLQIQGTVSFSSQQYLCVFALKNILNDFLSLYPKVTFEINTGTLGIAVEKLAAHECEFAVTAVPEDTSLYSFYPLFKEKHYLIGKKDVFPLHKDLQKEDFENLPFIVLNSSSARPTSDEVFRSMQISPRRVIVVDSDFLVYEYVKSGMGVSFMREGHLQNNKDMLDGVCVDTFFPDVEIGILTLKNAYLSAVSRLFINYCIDFFQLSGVHDEYN